MASRSNMGNHAEQTNFLEIAIFNASSAVIAYKSSADRLELCADGSSGNGGTTPSLSTLKSVITSLQTAQRAAISGGGQPTTKTRSIPVYAMIRPRGGDFVYSEEEFEMMKEQLRALKSAQYFQPGENGSLEQSAFGQVNGFVFGILTQDEKVDLARNAELVRLAAPLPCTFHRAFDEVITSCENGEDKVSERNSVLSQALKNELEAVMSAGFASILTSGGKERSAVDGASKIAALTEFSNGRIHIIAGGGVRSTNVKELKRKSPRTRFFHSSAIVVKEDGRAIDVADSDEVSAFKREILA